MDRRQESEFNSKDLTLTDQIRWGFIQPFFLAALLWFLTLFGICFFLIGNSWLIHLVWAGVFWLLSLVNLYVLTRLIALVLDLDAVQLEKRNGVLLQASYWGIFKLVCVGIWITALKWASLATLSQIGIVVALGTATMFVVPLLGGYLWSRKGIDHA